MKRIPTTEAIDAAELRVDQSKRNVRQSLKQTQSTVRETIKRPSTLLLVALASGVSAYLLTPRRSVVKSVANGGGDSDSAPRPSGGGLLRWLITMYGARVLAFALQQGTASATAKPDESVDQNVPGTTISGIPAAS